MRRIPQKHRGRLVGLGRQKVGKKSRRSGVPVPRHRRPRVEFLEDRRLLAASLAVEYRDFPFLVTGSFTGDHQDEYLDCSDPPESRPYRDQYRGEASVSGTARYDGAYNNGLASDVSVVGEATGSDNFWSSYTSSYDSSATVADGGGFFTFVPSSSTPPTYSDIVATGVCHTDTPEYTPGLLGPSQGNWSLTDPTIELVAESSRFTGTLQSLTTGTTDARVVDAHLGYDAAAEIPCLKAEFEVSGAFPQAANNAPIGQARGVLIDGFGNEVEVLFEQDVYWNTGRITVSDPAFDLPSQGSGLDFRVTIEMQGDQITSNNMKTVSLVPDLVMHSAEFGGIGGVHYEYEIVGPDAISIPDIGFYWSTDSTLDASDTQAADHKSGSVTGGTRHTFDAQASDFTPPTLEHEYLIVAIDSLEQFDECNERNNQIAIALAPEIEVAVTLSYPATPLHYNGRAVTTVRVQNDSPIPLDVAYAYPEIATETAIASVSSNSPQVRVPANSLKTITMDQRVFWQWIPAENPMLDAYQKLQDDTLRSTLKTLEAAFDDVASTISPVTAAAVKAKGLITGVLDVWVEQAQLRNIDRPETDILIPLKYQPQAANREPEGAADVLAAQVPERKQASYESFLVDLGTSRLAITSLGVLLGNLADKGIDGKPTFLPTSTLTLKLQKVFTELSGASNAYQKALDPPNDDYENFAELAATTRAELEGAGGDPGLVSDVSRRLVGELAALRDDATDRSDGANRDGDRRWLTEQLASSGAYALERFFAQATSVRLERLLAPARTIASTAEEVVAYWDEQDSFPDDIRDALLQAGLDAETIDAMVAAIRDFDADAVAAINESENRADLIDMLDSADELLTILADCVALKFPSPEPLTPEQQARIASLRAAAFAAIEETATEEGAATDPTGALRRWVETAWQLTLQTGQISELADEINDGLLLLIQHASSDTGIGAIRQAIDAFREQGLVDATDADLLGGHVAEIESRIATGDWEALPDAIEAGIAAVGDLFGDASEGPGARLHRLLGSLLTALQSEPTLTDAAAAVSPILRGASDQPAVSGIAWQPAIESAALHAGGRVEIAMPGWTSTNPFTVRLGDGWTLDEDLLSDGDRQVARLHWDAERSLWTATFFVGSTKRDVQALIHRLQWQPSEDAPAEIQTTVEYFNGSGRIMSSEIVRFINTSANGFGNPQMQGDVNGDSRVTPLDALLIINLVNRKNSLNVELDSLAPTEGPTYPDVTDDAHASTLDALRVINLLSRLNRPAQAEGELPQPRPAIPQTFSADSPSSREETADRGSVLRDLAPAWYPSSPPNHDAAWRASGQRAAPLEDTGTDGDGSSLNRVAEGELQVERLDAVWFDLGNV